MRATCSDQPVTSDATSAGSCAATIKSSVKPAASGTVTSPTVNVRKSCFSQSKMFISSYYMRKLEGPGTWLDSVLEPRSVRFKV